MRSHYLLVYRLEKYWTNTNGHLTLNRCFSFLSILFLPRAWQTSQSKITFARFISTARGLGQGLSLIQCRVHAVCAVVNKQLYFIFILVEG